MDDQIHKNYDWELINCFSSETLNQIEFETTIQNLSEKLDLLSRV